MWLIFALLSGALYTGEMLMTRHILRAKKDPWAYSFFFSLIGAAISLPFMLASPEVPRSPLPWLLAGVLGLILVVNNLMMFRASADIEASLIGTIGKLKLVWVFALGIVLLHVSFSWTKLFGTLLAIAASVIVVSKFRRPRSSRALTLAIAATLTGAVVIILSKYLLDEFNAVSLTFFGIFVSAAVFNLLFMPNATTRIKNLAASDLKTVVIACTFGALANLALFQALSLRDANSVVVVSEVFLILILVGERMILDEKGSLLTKVASIALAVFGAILIQVK